MNFRGNRIKDRVQQLISDLGRRFEVHRVDDPPFRELRLEEVHQILLMNSEEMGIRREFSSRASELKGEMERS